MGDAADAYLDIFDIDADTLVDFLPEWLQPNDHSDGTLCYYESNEGGHGDEINKAAMMLHRLGLSYDIRDAGNAYWDGWTVCFRPGHADLHLNGRNDDENQIPISALRNAIGTGETLDQLLAKYTPADPCRGDLIIVPTEVDFYVTREPSTQNTWLGHNMIRDRFTGAEVGHCGSNKNGRWSVEIEWHDIHIRESGDRRRTALQDAAARFVNDASVINDQTIELARLLDVRAPQLV